MTIPYSGIAYIETKAYTETLAPPSIIGAAAPLGTLEPWDSHSATMLVRKIAGKALTRPATSGRPCFASIKQKPIANAAAAFRDNPILTMEPYFVLWVQQCYLDSIKLKI